MDDDPQKAASYETTMRGDGCELSVTQLQTPPAVKVEGVPMLSRLPQDDPQHNTDRYGERRYADSVNWSQQLHHGRDRFTSGIVLPFPLPVIDTMTVLQPSQPPLANSAANCMLPMTTPGSMTMPPGLVTLPKLQPSLIPGLAPVVLAKQNPYEGTAHLDSPPPHGDEGGGMSRDKLGFVMRTQKSDDTNGFVYDKSTALSTASIQTHHIFQQRLEGVTPTTRYPRSRLGVINGRDSAGDGDIMDQHVIHVSAAMSEPLSAAAVPWTGAAVPQLLSHDSHYPYVDGACDGNTILVRQSLPFLAPTSDFANKTAHVMAASLTTSSTARATDWMRPVLDLSSRVACHVLSVTSVSRSRTPMAATGSPTARLIQLRLEALMAETP